MKTGGLSGSPTVTKKRHKKRTLSQQQADQKVAQVGQDGHAHEDDDSDSDTDGDVDSDTSETDTETEDEE